MARKTLLSEKRYCQKNVIVRKTLLPAMGLAVAQGRCDKIAAQSPIM